MRLSRSPTLFGAVVIAAALACVLAEPAFVARAQTVGPDQLAHVICVTNETPAALTLLVKETPEAPGPMTGFGAIPNAPPYCYRRVATRGRIASIAIGGEMAPIENIRNAADFSRLGAQLRAQSELPPVCEISPALIEQADVEQRRAILVRIFSVEAGYGCATSVGAAPLGAGGIESFETTRDGRAPVYYESSDRQSFALCVASNGPEIAAWPQERPRLPEDFLPKADVVRIGRGLPWCDRVWLRPGGDVVVSLGDIRAREAPNSPDFSEACTISADLVAQARAGDRQGVLVSVSRRRGQRQCEATLTSAPERAVGLYAFNPPPIEQDQLE